MDGHLIDAGGSKKLNLYFMKKFLRIFVAVVVVAMVGFVAVRYFFVFGEGVKVGTLNYVVKKGFLFKTYEGEMILTGLQSKGANMMQSNEFLFSIVDEEVAQKLISSSGRNREMELHYKEYLGAIPWRGYSKFIVDSVVSINDPAAGPAGSPAK
jgi:hypothetical protein